MVRNALEELSRHPVDQILVEAMVECIAKPLDLLRADSTGNSNALWGAMEGQTWLFCWRNIESQRKGWSHPVDRLFRSLVKIAAGPRILKRLAGQQGYSRR